MSKDIYLIDSNKCNDTITVTNLYGISGKLTDNVDEPVFAKQTTITKDDKLFQSYWIKMSKTGSMYNPYGMYDENQSKRKISGKDEWNFRAVNKRSFEFYLQFLKTKNRSWLTNAEREIA